MLEKTSILKKIILEFGFRLPAGRQGIGISDWGQKGDCI
jgi:hypothetical protein